MKPVPWRMGLLGLAAGLASSVALAAAFPAVLRIPRSNAGASTTPAPALFSHRAHASFTCNACHPSIFPQAPVSFTHQQMRDGQYCGQCHDGRTAFAITGAACGGCHVDAR